MLQKLITKENRIYIFVLSGILTLLLILGYEIEHYNRLAFYPVTLLAAAGVFAVSFCVVTLLFYAFDRITLVQNKEIRRKKVFPASFGILFVIYIIWLLGVYPGLFIFDAPEQFALYSYGLISEQQPALHTVLLGLILSTFADGENISTGVFVYSLIQILVSVAAFSYAISYIAKKAGNKYVPVLLTAFFGIYPPIVFMVLSTTKDSCFFAFFMFFATLMAEYFEDTAGFMKKVPKVILFCISVTMMMIFRNNCVYAVPFLILPLLILTKKENRKNAGILTGVIVLLFLCYKLLFVSAFVNIKVDGREKYSIPLQQMMRIATSRDSIVTAEEIEVIENLVSEEGRVYVPAIADIPKSKVNMDYYYANKAKVQSAYFNMIADNPVSAAEAFLATNCGLWYPASKLTLYRNGDKGYWPAESYEPAKTDSRLPMITDYLKGFNNMYYSDQRVILPLLFSPGSAFFLFLFFFTFAIYKKRKDFITLGLFVLMYWATFLLGPVALVRYAIYLYGMIPFYLLLIKRRRGEQNE